MSQGRLKCTCCKTLINPSKTHIVYFHGTPLKAHYDVITKKFYPIYVHITQYNGHGYVPQLQQHEDPIITPFEARSERYKQIDQEEHTNREKTAKFFYAEMTPNDRNNIPIITFIGPNDIIPSQKLNEFFNNMTIENKTKLSSCFIPQLEPIQEDIYSGLKPLDISPSSPLLHSLETLESETTN